MEGMFGYGLGFHSFGLIFWLLILGLIFLLLHSDSSNQSSNSALDILKNRYAKGEISREEYQEKKKSLT